MSGKPVLVASANESVLFPAPASPVTTTRRPMADGAPRMAVSIAHVPARWDAFVPDHDRVILDTMPSSPCRARAASRL